MNKPLTMRYLLIIVVVVLLGLGIVLLPPLFKEQDGQDYGETERSGDEDPGSFLQALPGRILSFPEDHGSHPDYQSEWWYYTGNLRDDDGRHFGFQLTFFRRALLPPDQRIKRSSDWGTDQVYMAHLTLADTQQADFHAFERFARGAVELAGTGSDPYQVWLHDWKVEEVKPGVYHMLAARDGIALDLYLADMKGPVLHGESGYSQKGINTGDASYYYSQTRLETSGTIRIDGKVYPVSGFSWMDHEFSTSALSEGQIGWDWFSIQLEDGNELMVFNIRREDGSIDPYSSGTFITPQGESRHLSRSDFQVKILDNWKSPHSGSNYPSHWRIEVPSEELSLELVPHQSDQELNLSYTYWEGAVSANGFVRGLLVSGDGYVEMTGYAGSIVGEF